jgi:hypothetical protein
MAKNTNNDLAAEKSAKNRLAVLNAIAELEEKIAKKREEGVDYDVELNKQLEKSQRNLVKIDKFLNGNNQKIKDGIDLYKESADSISSMSSMMGGLKDELKKTTEFGIEFSKSIANTAGRNKGVFQDSNKLLAEITSLTSDLAQLNREDAIEIASKANEIDSLYKKLSDNISELETKGGRMTQNDQELLRILKERFEVTKGLIIEASKFANLEKETKEIYEELGSDLEGIEKTFKKVAITASIFFSSFKNAAGVALFYIGGMVDEFNELSKGIGGTITQMFQLKAQSFLVSKLLGDEAGAAVTSLAEKMGNANDVTLGMSVNVGVMSGRLGVSGEEAAQLVNQFGNLSGLSSDTALNTMEAASQLASANGVAPSAVMKDIAQNTEAFALYAKDGGGNMAQAAIEARRLGVDLGTAAKISDNLLDYQTSVQSEMEASVLLGRNLNLNKARELAYAGDTAGAMKEALNAAGGIDEFNKMDVYQKRAVAEALGTSVAELQQMSANMERAATPAGKLEATFGATTAFVQEMGQGIAGTAVKGIGGMLIGMKDFKTQLSDAKEGFTFLKDAAKGVGGLITGKGFQGFGGLTDTKEIKTMKGLGKGGSISPTAPKGGGKEAQTAAGQKQLAGGFTAMGQPGVGKGILNTALAGPALLLLSIGSPGMLAVGYLGMKAGAGLVEMATGLMAFSAVPITAVGTLAATGAAFAVMTLGSIGLAAVAIGGVAAGAGLISLAGGLEAMGAAAATGLPFLGLALIAGFGAAMIPLTYALSLLEPLVTSIGNTIVNVIGAISSGISQIVGSITSMMTAILPLLSIESALGLLAVAGGFWALSTSLMAFAGASLLAVPGMLAVGAFMALGGDVMLGGNTAGGGNEGEGGLLEEIKGLRADIKNLAVVVNLDNRQIYRGHVQSIKNNSQG